MTFDHEGREHPSRRQFLRTIGGAAGAALAAPAYANHHGKPTPQSLTYLEQRTYIHNMEVHAHLPDERGFAGEMMTIGPRRFLLGGRNVLEVTDPRKPAVVGKGGLYGEVAYNKQLKKWILMQALQPPYFAAADEHMPDGKYHDAKKIIAQQRAFKDFRGIRMWDVSDPARAVQLSEFTTGETGMGTHGDSNFYDGGRYAYLDTAPDDTYTGVPNHVVLLSNSLMIVDVSDPMKIKEVSRWHVPGQRAGVPGETQELKKWRVLEGRGAEQIPDKPLTIEEATEAFRHLKFPAFDRFPFTMSHLPFFVPKRVEDGGTMGYGSWGAFGFLIHDISDITKPRLIGRFDPTPSYGLDGIPFHTIWMGPLPRGFVLSVGESLNPDCNESWLPSWVIDVRNPRYPVPVAQLPRPIPPRDAPYADYCFKRGRFSPHLPPAIKAPGRMSHSFLPLAMFTAGLRCYDLSDPVQPKEVAYFVPPHAGDITKDSTFARNVESTFVEWDRNIIYLYTASGLYVLSTPALGKPVFDAMPVKEWSLPNLNIGLPEA